MVTKFDRGRGHLETDLGDVSLSCLVRFKI